METHDLWEYVPQQRVALEKLGGYYASLMSTEAPSPAAKELIRLWKSGRRKSSRARTLRASEPVGVGLGAPEQLHSAQALECQSPPGR